MQSTNTVYLRLLLSNSADQRNGRIVGNFGVLDVDLIKEIFWVFHPYQLVVTNISVSLDPKNGGNKLF